MSLLEAFPREQGRRGADRGIDGVVYFIDGPRNSTRKAIVQVKSGRVSSPLIRDLKGTVEREKATLGAVHHAGGADAGHADGGCQRGGSTARRCGSGTFRRCRSARWRSCWTAEGSSFRRTRRCTRRRSALSARRGARRAWRRRGDGGAQLHNRRGFKSIKSIKELELGPLTVLIGPNGSGKSNFLGVFSFLNAIRHERLQDYVLKAGGADNVLHFGSRATKHLRIHASFQKERINTRSVLCLLPQMNWSHGMNTPPTGTSGSILHPWSYAFQVSGEKLA